MLLKDESANMVIVPASKSGTKRKAVSPRRHRVGRLIQFRMLFFQDVNVDEAEIRSKYENGTLAKVRSKFIDTPLLFPYSTFFADHCATNESMVTY